MRDVTTITPIDRDDMVGLATTEYERLFELLGSLGDEEWNGQTPCDDWTVRLMVAHLLGAAEGNASVIESLRQLVRGKRRARAMRAEDIDGINAIQVDDRRHLSPPELLHQLRAVAPRAVAGRRKTPGVVRRIKVPTGVGYQMTMGHLVDIVYTRDQWMHRLDICDATGRVPKLTSNHDARIVADVVREWHAIHRQPFELILDGPAGGEYHRGTGGPRIELDAVEFCLILSGRLDKEMELSRPVVF